MTRTRVAVILKPVGDACNLKCGYCYYGNKAVAPSTLWRPSDFEIAAKGATQYCRSLFGEDSVDIKFIWHGGEPLLQPQSFYREVCEIEARLESEFTGVSYSNSIQTNGTLLTDEYSKFLVNFGFKVGVSFDGLPQVHDSYRVYSRGEGSSFRVISGIKRLQAAGGNPGIICVITDELCSRADEVYEFARNELQVRHLAVSPATSLHSNEPRVSPEAYADFMIALLYKWLRDDDPTFRIRELEGWLLAAMGGQSRVCTFSRSSCGRFPMVSAGGEISYCDSYGTDERFHIGSIHLMHNQHQEMIERHAEIKEAIHAERATCEENGCRYRWLCYGGCHRHWRDGKNYFCQAYKRIFATIETVIEQKGLGKGFDQGLNHEQYQ